MSKRRDIDPLGLWVAVAGVSAFAFRRQILAALLRLPPVRCMVGVERNVPIPMPDGVVLMADHYFPRARGSFSTILIRSTYGRGPDVGGILGLTSSFSTMRLAERGYHIVVQTTRGRFDSQGETAPFVDAAPDGRATLEWIARQPWFDGNLGMWGQSYLGYTQWAVAVDAPPTLKALVPGITSSQFSSVVHTDGALALDTILRWTYMMEVMDRKGKGAISGLEMMRQLGPPSIARHLLPAFGHLPLREADEVALGHPVPYYRDWLAHPDSDDPFWESIDRRAHLSRVAAPIHLVSGWYDFLLRELLTDYGVLKEAGRSPYLTIGPWAHTNLGATGETLRQGLDWFDAHLRGTRRRLREKPVRVRVMGADEWRELDTWPPPAQERHYYLHAGQRLSLAAPEDDSPPDRYRYDPADPTPAVGGALFMPPSGPVDNRALEARPDVLTYTTEPLAQGVEVIGPVRLALHVRSSLAHADFFGRLCDVHPDGRSINVCDGLFRVGPGKGQVHPDGSLRIEVDMWATAYRFRRGHRLRLQVSSGAHPRWSRNLGTGEPLATGTRMLAADQTIFHDSTHPSALVLPVTA